MTTVQEVKDAKKASLQNEMKYYSGLIAAHYSSVKNHSQHPIVQSSMTKNPAISTHSTFKTTSHVHHYKSTSFQPRTHFPNQNSKAIQSFSLNKKMDLSNKTKLSNPFNLRKYPCRSSMVKINPTASSYKPSNCIEKTVEHNNLLKKNPFDSKKQINHDMVNKSGSSSQSLMNELGELIKQLKQKSKHIDNKIDASSKVHPINKCVLDKSELKVPIDSKVFCNTLNNVSQTIDLEDKNSSILSNVNSSLHPLSKNSNSCLLDRKKEISHVKLPGDMTDSLIKPLQELRNNFQMQSSYEGVDFASIPCNETSQSLNTNFENTVALQRISMVKTPVKRLIRKRCNSIKKLSGTTLFASKYKVVNRKLPAGEQMRKVTSMSPEIKKTLKLKPVMKHTNSIKKTKGRARLITTKYKIINKKLPCVQSNSENSFEGTSVDNVCKLPVKDKCINLRTNKIKMKVNKLNSKYKIVNKNEKSVAVPSSLFAKENIYTKEDKLGNFVHQESKNFNKFSINNSSRKNMYAISRLHAERKVIKNMTPLKQNHLNPKRKKHNPIRNSFMSNSKYRTVNKQPSGYLKKTSGTAKSSNLSSNQNSSIDLDLLMELAAEKNESNGLATNSPIKHILIKRVYKSKNAIVNKNISSLKTKAAKMIKTKYSILNKKHSWQKHSFNKRLISPKSFKGHKFNSNYQRRISYFYNPRNKRSNSENVSTYFAGRSYSKSYHASKNKSIACSPFRSMVKTPKRFVLNRKVHLKSPNIMKLNSPVSKIMASRALNRSINRVLNASVKKRTSKVNIYCKFYNRFGRCNKGVKCPYVHDPSKIAVCTRFLRGTCKTENCPFSHEICPGKMAICSFFLLGSCTKNDCPYRHETLSPNAKLCKAFVEGYCPDGKQCKQAHVLICPQFVQGHCEKGKACPFPHPPPKEKKTIPNSSEKRENIKETGEILEKVSRYFECGNEPETIDNSSVNNIAVPRIRNLPEQPSFIAL